MTKKATNVMLNLIVAGNKFKIPDVPLPFGLKIAQVHSQANRVPVTEAALVMITALSDRPATVVMYVAVLKALADKLGHAATIADIAEAFPMGFPTEEALHRVWVEQKRHPHPSSGSDNWLDYAESW
jgi:hypothetical protein